MEKKLIKATLRILHTVSHPYSKAFVKELKGCPTAKVAIYILLELSDTETDKALDTKKVGLTTQIRQILEGYRKGHIPTRYL
jgi:hypothetical protein